MAEGLPRNYANRATLSLVQQLLDDPYFARFGTPAKPLQPLSLVACSSPLGGKRVAAAA